MKIGLMAGAAIAALFAATGASAQMAQPGWYGALDLGYPTTVETVATPFNGVCYPHATTTFYEFAARGSKHLARARAYSKSDENAVDDFHCSVAAAGDAIAGANPGRGYRYARPFRPRWRAPLD